MCLFSEQHLQFKQIKAPLPPVRQQSVPQRSERGWLCCSCVAATLTSYSENMERGGKYGEGSRGNLKQWHSQKSGMDSFLYRVDENMTASTYSLNKIPERNLESMSSHSAHSIPLYLMPRPNSVAGESLRPSCPSFSGQSLAFLISLLKVDWSQAVNCISDSLMFSPSSVHAVFPFRPQAFYEFNYSVIFSTTLTGKEGHIRSAKRQKSLHKKTKSKNMWCLETYSGILLKSQSPLLQTEPTNRMVIIIMIHLFYIAASEISQRRPGIWECGPQTPKEMFPQVKLKVSVEKNVSFRTVRLS